MGRWGGTSGVASERHVADREMKSKANFGVWYFGRSPSERQCSCYGHVSCVGSLTSMSSFPPLFPLSFPNSKSGLPSRFAVRSFVVACPGQLSSSVSPFVFIE